MECGSTRCVVRVPGSAMSLASLRDAARRAKRLDGRFACVSFADEVECRRVIASPSFAVGDSSLVSDRTPAGAQRLAAHEELLRSDP